MFKNATLTLTTTKSHLLVALEESSGNRQRSSKKQRNRLLQCASRVSQEMSACFSCSDGGGVRTIFICISIKSGTLNEAKLLSYNKVILKPLADFSWGWTFL